MNEDLIQKQIITDLKDLISKAENVKNETDMYCELMRNLILNSYRTN